MRLAALMLLLLAGAADATSIKMDFLPLGSVRTDALLNPTCLSDHGARSPHGQARHTHAKDMSMHTHNMCMCTLAAQPSP